MRAAAEVGSTAGSGLRQRVERLGVLQDVATNTRVSAASICGDLLVRHACFGQGAAPASFCQRYRRWIASVLLPVSILRCLRAWWRRSVFDLHEYSMGVLDVRCGVVGVWCCATAVGGQVAGHSRQAAGQRSQVAGYFRQVAGQRSHVVRHRRKAAGQRSQVAGHRGQVAGHRSQVAGHRREALPFRRWLSNIVTFSKKFSIEQEAKKSSDLQVVPSLQERRRRSHRKFV